MSESSAEASKHGYFLVADLLGFGEMISNSSSDEAAVHVSAWIELVTDLVAAHGIERYQLVSDTLFVGVPEGRDSLEKLIDFAHDLLERGIANFFPIRGALVEGQFTWGQLIYGEAVVKAYTLEKDQNWIGISCVSNLAVPTDLWAADKLVCYPPPLKKGFVGLQPVVGWSVPKSADLFSKLTQRNRVPNGKFVHWGLGEKANNTMLFGLYMEMLKKTSADPSQYRGTLPVHAIESGLGLRD